MASSLPVDGGPSTLSCGKLPSALSKAAPPGASSQSIRNQSHPALPIPEMLDTCQAASLVSVSRRHFLRMNDAEQVPAPIRLGRSVRWGRVELSAWIEHGCPPRNRWSAIWQSLRGKGLRHG